MCGVCGIAAPGGGLDGAWASHHVRAMIDALAHRGPDDSALHGAGAAVLGATRLAIRGLADGQQPMVDAGQRPRGGLQRRDRQPREPPRVARGARAPRRLRDRRRGDPRPLPRARRRLRGAARRGLRRSPCGILARSRLLLARDRAGERPLFYCHATAMVRFATEISALAVDPSLELTPDRRALGRYVRAAISRRPRRRSPRCARSRRARWSSSSAAA